MNRHNPLVTFVYQPQIDPTHHRLTGIEILTRFDQKSPHSFLMMLSPLEKAYHAWAQVKEAIELSRLHKNITFSINIDLEILLKTPFVEWLSERNLETLSLTLEIIETALPRGGSWKDVTDVLNQLQMIGVKISLDDLGEGHSHFIRLGLLPVDEVKLSKRWLSFELSEQARWMQAIHSLSNEPRIVVEGVETEEELQHVKTYFSHVHVQGYVYAAPASDVTPLFSAYK